MKRKIHKPKTKFKNLLYFILLFISTHMFADIGCGTFEGFEFTNGHESVDIINGENYVFGNLPGHFYVKALIHGDSESVKFNVENLDTGKKFTIIENILPYTFPAGNGDWNIGNGTFKITASLYKYDSGYGICDVKTFIFTLGDTVCTADAGTLHATASNVTLTGNSAMISATADGDINVPDGYSSIFVLTSGEDLVINAVSTSPEFTVTSAGLYTIHTLVYDGRSDSANFLDLGIVEFGTTTGVDVLTVVTNAGLCAALDVAGAPVMVEEEEVCTADAGSMYSKNPIQCLEEGISIISAKTTKSPVIPDGYERLFVLTEAYSLTILNVSSTPEFEVNHGGFYRIHSLVYKPETLDLSVVVLGETTGFDVAHLIADNDICASLDVHGAINLVIGSKWFCYFFNKHYSSEAGAKNSLSSKGRSNNSIDKFVNDYSSYEAFKKDFIATYSISNFFPNPVVNSLKVELELFDNEIMSYNIIDIRGRNVISGVASDLEFGLQTIDARNLNNGMYVVQFVSEYRTIIKKIVVNK